VATRGESTDLRRDAIHTDVAHADDDVGALRRERGQWADRVEPHGRTTDVRVLELVETCGHLWREQIALHPEERRDAGGIEVASGLRILDPRERALDAIDVVDLRDGGGQVHDPLDIGRIGRRAMHVGEDHEG